MADSPGPARPSSLVIRSGLNRSDSRGSECRSPLLRGSPSRQGSLKRRSSRDSLASNLTRTSSRSSFIRMLSKNQQNGINGASSSTVTANNSYNNITNINNNTTTNTDNGSGNLAGDELTSDEMVVVERPILTEFDLDQGGFEKTPTSRDDPVSWLKRKVSKCSCSCACLRGFFLQVFPFLRLLRGYSVKRDLPMDMMSGLTCGVMHIPQGMAYAQLAQLPAVYGLYTSFFPVIIYFFFGSSKHISIGTFAVVSLMMGTVINKGLSSQGLVLTYWNETVINGTAANGSDDVYYTRDNSEEVLSTQLAFAMAVTFAVGCVQLLMGLLRLGFVTVYLSDPLISGFTTGAAFHVFTSQVKHLFGLTTGRYSGPLNLVWTYRDLFTNLPKTNSVTLIASLVCILVLVVIKEYVNNNPKIKPRLPMPVPVELIVVVLGTVISYFIKLEETYNVKVVGDVPVGIPPPKVQQFTYLSLVVSDAIAMGIVAFAISVSMAKILAKKHDYDIDSNQELLAYGVVNIGASFFSSFVSAASMSRSLVQENVGGRTQVSGLVSSALLLVVLLVLGTYFKTLPNCVLAAIIVVALKGMFKQFGELKKLWGISLIDFSVWLVAFVATVLLDVELGLLAGILFALLTVIIRSQRPHACLVGQVPGTDLYRDIGVVKAAKELSHIKIFRFDSALFFANSEFFKTCIYKLAADPKVLKKLRRKADKELARVQVSDPQTAQENPETTEAAVEAGSGTPSSAAEQGSRDAAIHSSSSGAEVGGGTSQDSPTDYASDGTAAAATAAANTRSEGNRRSSVEAGSLPEDLLAGVTFPTLTNVYFIIIDCGSMSYVDSVGVKVLKQVIQDMKSYDIQVFFAHCKAAIREMFERTGFYGTSDKECLFLTVHDAVLYAQRLMALVQGVENADRESHRSDNYNNSGSSRRDGGGDSCSSTNSSIRYRRGFVAQQQQQQQQQQSPAADGGTVTTINTPPTPSATPFPFSTTTTTTPTTPKSGKDVAVTLKGFEESESTHM